jgi:hypothetical protein
MTFIVNPGPSNIDSRVHKLLGHTVIVVVAMAIGTAVARIRRCTDVGGPALLASALAAALPRPSVVLPSRTSAGTYAAHEFSLAMATLIPIQGGNTRGPAACQVDDRCS